MLAKLGMSYEGRMRETMRLTEGWRDSDLYAILDGEWQSAVPDQRLRTA